MKKHIILFLVILGAAVMSCKDDALDPLQTKKVQKGIVLALRGNALDDFYWGAVGFTDMGPLHLQASPQVADGTETFEFDAEYLSEDPNSLESVDFFVLKPWTGERKLLKNVLGSTFTKDATYPKPWTHISIKLTDMLTALGLANTIPLPAATVDSLLNGSYGGDLKIEADLNLKNGKKVLSSEMVAAGLYQSDQFFPAQALDFFMDEYCAYTAGTWDGATCAAGYSDGDTNNYYADALNQDGGVANRFHIGNFLGGGFDMYFDMAPSTTPYNQLISIPNQTIDGLDLSEDSDSGQSYYDQCSNSITLFVLYDDTSYSINIALD